MTALFFGTFPALDGHFCLLLTYGLIHFLWQGCLLAFAFALVRRLLAGASAHARYAAGVATLLLMAACLPVTLALIEPTSIRTVRVVAAPQGASEAALDQAVPESSELEPAAAVAPTSSAALGDKRALGVGSLEFGSTTLARAAIYATTAYAAGLLLMLARVFVGLWIGRRLRGQAMPLADAQTLEFVRRQASRLALRAVPAVAWCQRVSVPVVVGVVRPMILLPASLVTGLSARQLELILLHELAHIHRYDPLVNLMQRLIEAMLFFHPAVWWLSRQVSMEREQACDDAVLRAGSEGPAYADALLRVAELCAALSNTAAGPTGSLAAINRDKNQLRRRILRLVAADRPTSLRPAAPAAMLMGLLFACAILGLAICRRPAIAQVTEPRAIASEAKTTQTTAGEDQPANTAARVLHFPADRAMGFLWTRPAQGDYSTLVYHQDLQPLGVARGDVDVPAGVDVHLEVGNVASKDLTGLDGLAPDDVQFLNFRYTQLDDEGLRHVGRLTGLRSLNLMYAAAVSDAGVEHLAGLKQLRAIRFDGLQARRQGGGIGDAALAVLAGLPELRRVDVRRMPKITDAGLAKLAPLKKLVEIDLGGTSITDVGLALLRQFPLLENLDLGVYRDGAPITDAGLVHIGALARLKSLDLDGTAITEAGLAHLAPLTRLEILSLNDTKISQDGLEKLEPLQALRMLGFRVTGNHHRQVSDTGAAMLARLKSLTRIDADLRLTEQGLSALSTLAGLEQLELEGQGITDAAAEHLVRMQNLKSLRLRDCPLGDAGLARLATLPALEKLALYDTDITGDGLASLAESHSLISLGVGFDDRRQLEHAAHQISKLTGLKTLNISGKTQIYVQLFQGLDHLEELRIDSSIDNVQASYIAHLASLRMLVLTQSTITDSGLEELSQLDGLNVLHVEGYFTDKGLASLDRLKALENLNISSPYVSQSAVDTLAAALPALQTIQLRDNDPLRELRRRQAERNGKEVPPPAPAQVSDEAGPIRTASDRIWDTLGLRLEPAPPEQFGKTQSKYRGGLRVAAVRPGSPAEQAKIVAGDILVGLYDYETLKLEHVDYVLNLPNIADTEPLKFYILHDNQSMFGHFERGSWLDSSKAGNDARSGKKIRFIGNTIGVEGRIKTQTGSKPPILGLFKGPYDEQNIAEDIDKLADYYRNLGFFRAKINRQVSVEKKAITFIIDEGPRYRVSGISFAGKGRFTAEQLSEGMTLKQGGFYRRSDLNADVDRLKKRYADAGHPDADIRYELRLDEESAQVGVKFTVPE